MIATTAPSTAAPFTHEQILRVMSGVALCILLSALDQTIVVPAVPSMARDLAGFGHISWIVSAYLLTSTAATPILGKLSDLHGRRSVLLASIALFTLTSILCGLGQSLPQMVLFRALQGVGGAGLLAMSHATIADIASPRERGRYQLFLSGTWGVAAVVGPLAGGFLTDHLSWRFIFWINLPLGFLAFVLTRRALAILPRRQRFQAAIDYAGATLMTLSITTALLLLSWGGSDYAWTSSPMLALGGALVILLALLTIQERRIALDPLFPARLFTNGVAVAGFALSFCNALGMLGGTFLLPLYFQFMRGADASSSGVLLMPFLLAFVVVSYIGGKLGRRIGRTKWLMVAASALTALGLALLGTASAHTSGALVTLFSIVTGGGIGLIQPCITTTVQNAVETRDLGIATSSTLLFRMIGGAFGATMAGALLTGRLNTALHAQGLATHVTLGMLRSGRSIEGAGSVSSPAIEAALPGAFHLAFLGCAAVSLLAVLIALVTRDVALRTTIDSRS